ncbi:Fosmidomycin resistance protein [Pseudomonas caricapapayae]|uniref:Fosmidomycin resistance protein n=1 Tax=Pseudomonas caricapapayae TaxID=46678 RepID=A0A3M6EI37_9PSED|nr:MFS transporter [Pseudomonas caricapapayae]RMV68010.1 Fosmidomycin resistance protein [Pseudomonas caricapapayae]
MSVKTTSSLSGSAESSDGKFLLRIVGAVAFAHLINDLIQALLPSIYPMLKESFSLSFAQIGLLAMVYQFTASLLQPWIGLYTDKHPKPYLLPCGMVMTLLGVAVIAYAKSYEVLLLGSAVVGVGSAIFHPEAARVARMASGGRYGTAQSTFQTGGNTGSALGPLLAAMIVIPNGQPAVAWFMIAAAIGLWVLSRVSAWTINHGHSQLKRLSKSTGSGLSQRKVLQAVAVIAILLFAKFAYTASFSNYFTFYLIERFGLSTQESQLYLFVFLGAGAVGTFFGGPIGDRIGRKAVIWISFLGVAPFALLLPYVTLGWTLCLIVPIGLIMSSAFSALVVYAQEAVPGKVGMISGVMSGMMFGIGGISAAGLGALADTHGVVWVYGLTSYLPLLGLFTFFLPKTKHF